MLDCKVNDQTLKYFNEKASIKFNLSADEMVFYSIAPLMSAEELLSKSKTMSTNNESEGVEGDDESECELEYCSQSSEGNEKDRLNDFGI
jgi:hypothetical protein